MPYIFSINFGFLRLVLVIHKRKTSAVVENAFMCKLIPI
jgi:hypothetical protein